MHDTQNRKRPGVIIDVTEFDAAMRSMGAETPQQMARLLECGESTISRLRGHKQCLSAEMILQFSEMFGAERMNRICGFAKKIPVAA